MYLHFEGPFQWIGPDPARSVLEAPTARSSGIYLWTARCVDGYLPSYVGETGRDFRVRMREHLREQLAGAYTIRDPDAYRSGSKVLVWRGLLGRLAEPGGLPEYVKRLPDILPALLGFIHSVHFHLAATSCDTRMRRRVEAALAARFHAQTGRVATFQDEGVRYDPRLPHEAPVTVICSAVSDIIGLPSSFEA